MKILMIAPQPFFEPRGTPISVFQRLHGLSALGHEIHLITYHVGADVDIPNVKITRTPSLPFIKKVKVGPSLAKIPLDIMLVLLTIWVLIRRRYDVIHSHEEAAFWTVPLSALFRTRHLYDMHSSLPRQLENFKFGNVAPIVKVFEWLENWVINTADVVLTIGLDLEEHVYSVKPDANHIRIENTALHNIIDVDSDKSQAIRHDLGISDEQIALVYTGTFEIYQGLDLLMDAIALLKPDYPQIRLVMVGGKPEQVEEQKAEARKRSIDDVTIFTGIVSLEDSLLYLDLADMLVSPRSQGLSVPLKIYTYLFSERPIIATSIPAHTLVLDETTAVLAEPNGADYAEGIKKLVTDPALRETIGRAGKALAQQKFSKAEYLNKLNTAYRSIELSMPIQYLPAETAETKG